MARPQDSKPDNPDTPPLRAFEQTALTERDIATKIGSTVTKVKEEYQKRADQNSRGNADVDAERATRRRAIASKIFEEFGMLEKSGEVAFSTLYTTTERRVQSEEIPKSELVDTVLNFENHPVIRTAISLAMVVGDRYAKEDAIAIQRTAALLLGTVEPARTWGEPEQ